MDHRTVWMEMSVQQQKKMANRKMKGKGVSDSRMCRTHEGGGGETYGFQFERQINVLSRASAVLSISA